METNEKINHEANAQSIQLSEVTKRAIICRAKLQDISFEVYELFFKEMENCEELESFDQCLIALDENLGKLIVNRIHHEPLSNEFTSI